MILVRHTRPELAPGICYGASDVAAARGIEAEADRLAALLAPATRVVASPLRRCLPLAEGLAARLGAPLGLDARWREMDFGAWEGRPWDLIARNEIDAWDADFMQARPHGGESVAMLAARTAEALAAARAAGGRVVVVTHAGPIRAALGAWDRAIGFGEAIEA